MLRLTERRPISRLLSHNGDTTGIPADGQGSSLSCVPNQSGSTHTSATQVSVPAWPAPAEAWVAVYEPAGDAPPAAPPPPGAGVTAACPAGPPGNAMPPGWVTGS